MRRAKAVTVAPPQAPTKASPASPAAALPTRDLYEFWALLFAIDEDLAVRCYSVNRQLHAIAKESLLGYKVLPLQVRRLKAKRACVMFDLCEALALSADEVRRGARFKKGRGHGGGHYNLFYVPSAVDALLEENGGLLGLQERIAARRKQEANEAKRREAEAAARRAEAAARQVEAAARQAYNRSRLQKGFAVIGLSLRSDSEMCSQFIESGEKTHTLLEVMKTMAHMKYIHEYTDYNQFLELRVEEEGECNGFYPGIWRETAEEVQGYAEFQLPNKLPWLGDKFNSTGDAIRAAVAAARSCQKVAQRPEQVAQPQQRESSTTRKRERVQHTAEAAVDAPKDKKALLRRFAVEIVKAAATGAALVAKLPRSAYKALVK